MLGVTSKGGALEDGASVEEDSGACDELGAGEPVNTIVDEDNTNEDDVSADEAGAGARVMEVASLEEEGVAVPLDSADPLGSADDEIVSDCDGAAVGTKVIVEDGAPASLFEGVALVDSVAADVESTVEDEATVVASDEVVDAVASLEEAVVETEVTTGTESVVEVAPGAVVSVVADELLEVEDEPSPLACSSCTVHLETFSTASFPLASFTGVKTISQV